MAGNPVAGAIGEYEIICGHITGLLYKITHSIPQKSPLPGLLDICTCLRDECRWSSSSGYDTIASDVWPVRNDVGRNEKNYGYQ